MNAKAIEVTAASVQVLIPAILLALLALSLTACFFLPTPPPTSTPTATSSATPTPSPTLTPSPTFTATPTPTPFPTPTATPTHTPSPTPARTPTPTLTPSPSPSPAPTPTPDVAFWEDTITLPTYPYARFLRYAVDPSVNNFPYQRFDRAAYEASGPRPEPQTYRRLNLRNRYLHVTLLPDLGGRIYQLIFRPSGNNELYQNPVIKPTRWGPDTAPGANWWLAAGGIEWGFPVHEHGHEFGISWGFITLPEPRGQTLIIFDGHSDIPHVRVNLTLLENRADLALTFHVVNPTDVPVRVKYWTNAMVAPGPQNRITPDFQFIYPTDTVLVHSTSDPELPGEYQPFSWPLYRGRDFSYPRNWRGYLGFFAHPQARASWAAVYDHAADEGLVRVFPRDVARGLKGFAAAGAIDPGNWTDDGSTYAEMHGGLAPTFRDWVEIPPGGIIQWTETWFPVWRIGGLVDASLDGALNLEREGDALRVGFFPTHPVTGILSVTLDGRAFWAQEARVAPDAPITAHVPLPPDRPHQATVAVQFADPQGHLIMRTEQEMLLR